MTDDILDKLPDEELSEEEHEALLLMCGHGIGPTLSPAAHAVLYATHKAMAEHQFALSGVPDYRQVAAAAIRALANHNTPAWDGIGPACHWTPVPRTRQELLNIADELEGV